MSLDKFLSISENDLLEMKKGIQLVLTEEKRLKECLDLTKPPIKN